MEISMGVGGFLVMHTHRGKVIAISLFALVALGGCANLQQKWNMLKSRRAFKQANQAYSSQEYEKGIWSCIAIFIYNGPEKNRSEKCSTMI